MKGDNSAVKKLALRFVLIIGVVQLFADMTYEGARGITGPFLGSLGASAAVVGFTAGLGELMGYAFRSVTGYFADKTHKYWVFIFAGYFVNMLAMRADLSGDPTGGEFLARVRDVALEALMTHPLIGQVDQAERLLDDLLAAHRQLLPAFA